MPRPQVRGATISSITATVAEASSGIEIVSAEEEVLQVVVDSESNLIPANGTATVGLDVHYTLPSGGSEAAVDVSSRVRNPYI